MPPKLLITGASGFLGSALTKELSDFQIIGISRKKQILKGIDWVTPENLSTLRLDSDIVVHAATAYGRNEETKQEIKNVNLDFATDVLNISIQRKAKAFINIDTSQPASTSEYANTKAQFREILKRSEGSIRIVNLELEHFYGPQASATNFILWLVDSFLLNAPVIELSPCEQDRDFIHIDDVVRAIRLILKKEFSENAFGFFTFEIGSGQTIKLRALIDLLKEMTENTKTSLLFGARPYKPGEPMHSIANIEKLRVLGFSPKIGLKEGLQQVVNFRRRLIQP